MKAYLIGEIEVTDRAGKIKALEGDWTPERVVVIEFPSMGKALAWSRSPEFEPLSRLQRKASRGKFVIADGV